MNDILPLAVDGRVLPRPYIIAGPCSAESRRQTLDTARQLAEAGVEVYRAGVWKPRTKPGGFEGMGAPALEWLREVKEITGMATAVEVATAEHALEALQAGVDILWIGARTTGNPFAVQEIADLLAQYPDTPVLVKNPMHPDIELWVGALQRLYNAGLRRLGAIHRGFALYGAQLYRNHPLWRIPLELRRRLPNLPIICDPSHIGGARDLIAPLAQQALDMGFDGLIIESHCSPDCALSDAAQQLTPADFAIVKASLQLRTPQENAELKGDMEDLDHLRSQIDYLDRELLDILNRRMQVCREIGEYKSRHGMPVVQASRYDDIMRRRVSEAEELGMSPDFMRTMLAAIHEESVAQQLRVMRSDKKG